MEHGNGIEKRAVFTLCDLERVYSRREGEFHHTEAIFTAVNLVPGPCVGRCIYPIEPHPEG